LRGQKGIKNHEPKTPRLKTLKMHRRLHFIEVGRRPAATDAAQLSTPSGAVGRDHQGPPA